MDLDNFSDLSDFIYHEYEKMSDAFGLQQIPSKSIKFAEKSIRKYTKLYDKPLYKKEKRELKLKILLDKNDLRVRKAIDSMPHCWLWKKFHSKLWAKMKIILAEQENHITETIDVVKESEKPDILVPAVVIPKEYDIEVVDNLQQDFSTDFD